MVLVSPLIVAVLLALVGVVVAWALWLSRQYGSPRWLRWLAVAIPVTSLGAAAPGVHGVFQTFGAIEHDGIDPSLKARMLAEGISEAMNCTALGVVAALSWAVVLLVLTWWYRWREPPAGPRGNPPYR